MKKYSYLLFTLFLSCNLGFSDNDLELAFKLGAMYGVIAVEEGFRQNCQTYGCIAEKAWKLYKEKDSK
jgi:hypothetical protein